MSSSPPRGSLSHGAAAQAARMGDDWWGRAACAGAARLMDPPPDLAGAYEAEALALCGICPVTVPCLSWVLSLGPGADPGGVAGGTTELGRAHLRGQIASARRRDRALRWGAG